MADGCSCYCSLGFIAVFSLSFFPWPFLLGQWSWAARDGSSSSHLYPEVLSCQWWWLLLWEAGSSSLREVRLGQLRAPGPTSSQTEHVFPEGTHTQSTPTHHIYTYIHGWPHGSQTDTRSTHMNTDSNNGFILLPSLSEQDNGQLVGIYIHTHTHICTVWIPPAAGLRHSICPVATPGSQSSQLLALGDMSPWGHSPSPAVVQTTSLVHVCARAHTHTQSASSWTGTKKKSCLHSFLIFTWSIRALEKGLSVQIHSASTFSCGLKWQHLSSPRLQCCVASVANVFPPILLTIVAAVRWTEKIIHENEQNEKPRSNEDTVSRAHTKLTLKKLALKSCLWVLFIA